MSGESLTYERVFQAFDALVESWEDGETEEEHLAANLEITVEEAFDLLEFFLTKEPYYRASTFFGLGVDVGVKVGYARGMSLAMGGTDD